MNRWINLIIFSILINNICLADDSVILNKDDKAPFTGILFTPEKSQDLKNKLIERDAYIQLNDSLNKSLNFQQDIINRNNDKNKLCMDQNDVLAKSLYSERQMNDLEKFGLVLLGIGITGLTYWGYGQLHK